MDSIFQIVYDADPVKIKEKGKDYYEMVYKTLTISPVMLVIAAFFYIFSMLGGTGEAVLHFSGNLAKSLSWTESELDEKFANIRFVAHVMPS